MAGTIPADMTQYYVHAFRIMQKLAYLYGWQTFLKNVTTLMTRLSTKWQCCSV